MEQEFDGYLEEQIDTITDRYIKALHRYHIVPTKNLVRALAERAIRDSIDSCTQKIKRDREMLLEARRALFEDRLRAIAIRIAIILTVFSPIVIAASKLKGRK